MKKYTIEDASKGEVAIKNDGTYQQITDLLALAFPYDKFHFFSNQEMANSKFFFRSKCYPDKWVRSEHTNLPTQSVKDFLTPEWKPVRGEMVMVRDMDSHQWEPRIFLAEISGTDRPIYTVLKRDEDSFKKGLSFDVVLWAQMMQIMEPEFEENPNEMIKITVTLNGQNINPMRFSRRAWGKIRTNQ